MKSLLLLTASGPLLILTSHDPCTIRSCSRSSSTKELGSSWHLRFQCRSLGSATAGIIKRSRAICTRPMI